MIQSLTVQHISSLDLPELQPYRTLRRPEEHIRQGIFVAEGEKVVRRLLASNLSILSMLMTPEWYDIFMKDNLFPNSGHQQHEIFIAPKTQVETIVGNSFHQGIMAVARVPANISLDELMQTVRTPHLLVALDGLVSAENVGVIVRNCAAFGVDGIIVGETSSSPYLRRAVRNSMGAVFTVPVVHVTDLVTTLSILHNRYATQTIAAHPHEKTSIHHAEFTGNVCIVLGHEGLGVSPEALNVCTNRIAIPMDNSTDSLNVASASAVFMYEARKQRTKSK